MPKPLDHTFDLNHRSSDYLEESDVMFVGSVAPSFTESFTIPDTRKKWAVRFVFESIGGVELLPFVSTGTPTVPVGNSIIVSDSELASRVLLKKYNGGTVVSVFNFGNQILYFTASCYTLESDKPA